MLLAVSDGGPAARLLARRRRGRAGLLLQVHRAALAAHARLAWWVQAVREGGQTPLAAALAVARGMAGFVLVMVVADLAVTGFAVLPLSADWTGPPQPSRWVGRPVHPGGRDADPAGLGRVRQPGTASEVGRGELPFRARRMRGWWYYYLVALAVKVPLTFGVVFLVALARPCGSGGQHVTA